MKVFFTGDSVAHRVWKYPFESNPWNNTSSS